MKEIRFHGIGGLGTVKAGEMLVHAAVKDGNFGTSSPFFGFERQGAPVTSFVRLSEKKIREKTQVYYPDCVVVLDQSLLTSSPVFDGFGDDSILILNTKKQNAGDLVDTTKVNYFAYLDATSIAVETLGRAIPNTVMLGAFVKVTEWVRKDYLEEVIDHFFGAKNVHAFQIGYDRVNTQYFK